MDDKFKTFEDAIEISFHNKKLLQRAFTHRSYINEHKGSRQEHNERLEFLGDAVLELVSTDYLFFKYPDRTEGELTSYRAALVNTQSISEGANQWNMNNYLLLSKGEAKDTGKARLYILADTFEAVIGAIYLDQGYDAAKEFIAKSLFHKTEEMVREESWKDAKSRFQEKAQEVESITPVYKVIAEEGPDHSKDFTVGVFLNDEMISEAIGNSKQAAEQKAAEKALDIKGWMK